MARRYTGGRGFSGDHPLLARNAFSLPSDLSASALKLSDWRETKNRVAPSVPVASGIDATGTAESLAGGAQPASASCRAIDTNNGARHARNFIIALPFRVILPLSGRRPPGPKKPAKTTKRFPDKPRFCSRGSSPMLRASEHRAQRAPRISGQEEGTHNAEAIVVCRRSHRHRRRLASRCEGPELVRWHRRRGRLAKEPKCPRLRQLYGDYSHRSCHY